MSKCTAIISPFLLLIIGLTASCSQNGKTQEVTFDQLFANPQQYNDRNIIIEGFYFHGFEVIVLAEKLEYSGYVLGHLIPRGNMMWVEGGIPKEIYDKLYQQNRWVPRNAMVKSK